MANEPIELNHHYHDRGIKKYLGFYLSEHTRELHHMDEKHSTYHVGKPMMDFDEILSVINESILKQVSVRIQPNIANSDNGSFSNELVGKIQGYTETTIYIDELPIELSLIRHIELASEMKWYQGLD